jgi:carbon-monoxide dehydrogenase iron sulfur subunit
MEDGSIPLQCRHCKDAPCLDACSTGALRKDPETETVIYDDSKCITCWMCVMICPFGIISPSSERGMILKCDRCFDMEGPYCVEACPTDALMFIDTADLEEVAKEKRKGIVKKSFAKRDKSEFSLISLDFKMG